MRLVLLALALLYGCLPAGLCACRVEALVLAAVQSAVSDDPASPCDDDDDDPRECHCTGAKHLCILDAPVVHDNGDAAVDVAADLVPLILETAPISVAVTSPVHDNSETAFYLTLRALRI